MVAGQVDRSRQVFDARGARPPGAVAEVVAADGHKSRPSHDLIDLAAKEGANPCVRVQVVAVKDRVVVVDDVRHAQSSQQPFEPRWHPGELGFDPQQVEP